MCAAEGEESDVEKMETGVMYQAVVDKITIVNHIINNYALCIILQIHWISAMRVLSKRERDFYTMKTSFLASISHQLLVSQRCMQEVILALLFPITIIIIMQVEFSTCIYIQLYILSSSTRKVLSLIIIIIWSHGREAISYGYSSFPLYWVEPR